MKRLVACLFMLTLCLGMAITAYGEVTTNASEWAVTSMEQSYESGLIQEEFLYDAKSNITREDFSEMIIAFCEEITNTQINAKNESPFTDTNNPDVIAAYEIGIVGGLDSGLFAPENSLTREQLAIMLVRAISYCGLDLTPVAKYNDFTDTSTLYETSQKAINKLYGSKILSGDGDGSFNPHRELTVQEAVSALWKAYQYTDENVISSAIVESVAPVIADLEDNNEEDVTTTTDSAVLTDMTFDTVSIDGVNLSLLMDIDEVVADWGEPDRIDDTIYGFKRYIYLNDYEDYFFVTVDSGEVVEIFTLSPDFEYLGTGGNGTSGDIRYLDYISTLHHSAIITSDDTSAKIALDYAGNIGGLTLQTKTFSEIPSYTAVSTLTLQGALEQELYEIINVKRNILGLEMLAINVDLHDAALSHSNDMASNNYVDYNNIDGKTPFQRMAEEGVSFTAASELVSQQRGDVIATYQSWIRTAAKNSLIVDVSMNGFGIGVVKKGNDLFVTVDFCQVVDNGV